MTHYQARIAKRVEENGTIVTSFKLGRMYSHTQKTLKSCKNLDEAIETAKKYNPDLPGEVKGIVITQFKPGKLSIAKGTLLQSHITAQPRKVGTTEWVRFIDRRGKVYLVSPKEHKILGKLRK